jgi:hypothetical protein
MWYIEVFVENPALTMKQEKRITSTRLEVNAYPTCHGIG